MKNKEKTLLANYVEKYLYYEKYFFILRMNSIPYHILQHIVSFVDDIEVRREFNVYNQIYIPDKIQTVRTILPGISPDGVMRCILPNRLKSHERCENSIDNDTLDIRVQLHDDQVEYHYMYYIFGKSPDNMHNQHGGLNMILEIYCWHYYEFIYIRY